MGVPPMQLERVYSQCKGGTPMLREARRMFGFLLIDFREMRRALIALVSVVLGCASMAGAEPKVSFEVGWDGKYLAGRWTPVYVTISDAYPRAVVMQVDAPYDRRYQISLQQGLTIGPTPVTVPIYVPLNQSLQETRIVLTTPSGRRLTSV